MIIRTDPLQEPANGKQPAVPASLKKHIAKWAEVQYRQYDFGSILTQQYLGSTFNIYFFHFDIEEPVILYPHYDAPALALQFMLAGSLSCLLKGFGKIQLRELKHNLFYFPAGAVETLLQHGVHELLHIELNASFLQELSFHGGIPVLLSRLREGSASAQAMQAAAINKEIKSVIREMRNHQQEGNALNLVFKSDIYKLLSIYDEQLSLPADTSAYLLPAMEKKLEEVRRFIADDPDIHECSIGNLARRFDINSNTLRINFKNRFNITLHQFVLDQCMQQARTMILRGSESITAISHSLGYNDKSNFAKAFKQYFGISPREMRRKRE